MFYMNPVLLAQGKLPAILQALATAAIGVVLLAFATEGFMLRPLPLLPRLLVGAAALLCIIPEAMTDLAGLAIGACVFLWQKRKSRRDDALA